MSDISDTTVVDVFFFVLSSVTSSSIVACLVFNSLLNILTTSTTVDRRVLTRTYRGKSILRLPLLLSIRLRPTEVVVKHLLASIRNSFSYLIIIRLIFPPPRIDIYGPNSNSYSMIYSKPLFRMLSKPIALRKLLLWGVVVLSNIILIIGICCIVLHTVAYVVLSGGNFFFILLPCGSKAIDLIPRRFSRYSLRSMPALW